MTPETRCASIGGSASPARSCTVIEVVSGSGLAFDDSGAQPLMGRAK